MKNYNLWKASGFLILALGLIGSMVFFSSSSSVEESNSQSIEALSAEIAKAKSELDEVKSGSVSADPFIGEVILFAGNFAPRGWAFCDGRLLPIAQYSALFSILGTTYGGDGRTTFGLPDLRGRVPVGAGNGPGLTPRRSGQKFGVESITLRQGTAKTNRGSGRGQIDVVSTAQGQFNVLQPSLGMYYIIALEGTYPSRS